MNRRNFIDRTFWLSLGFMGAGSSVFALGKSVKTTSFNNSFVTVSKRDNHYFQLSNGNPFIVNGPCLAGAPDMATMETYLQNLSANGGNFARVWLCNHLFEIEKQYGVYDEAQAQKIDILLAWAIKYQIKLKLCLDNTRQIIADTHAPFNKPQYHVDNGGPFKSVDEYINTSQGRQAYLNRIDFLKKRYGDHPAVFGWELWNEMNGIMCKGLQDWNVYMLPQVKKRFSENLIMQSLGSFDMDSRRNDYRFINQLPGDEVGQIHRYIDAGAKLAVCTAPMDVLAADAINELRSYHIQKPMLLAEVGAVMPNHTGSSELYPLDKDGALLHDMLFAPFFSGAAGSGNSWHWDTYIHKNNLWYHFDRFNQVVTGLDPAREQFKLIQPSHNRFRVYALTGLKTILVWCRDIKNDWRSEFVDNQEPETIRDQRINLNALVSSASVKKVSLFDPWKNEWFTAKPSANIELPVFKRSIVIKIERHER